jgi:hypothetical protein
MKIYGIDFTSSPSRRKCITCVECSLENTHLTYRSLSSWPTFYEFETQLQQPGPWIAGIDFPFGQARRFIETIGWPPTWQEYVRHAASLGKSGFIDTLNAYRITRRPGDKEHRRETDKLARSISPQKLYGVPVGKMFYEGAPRLLAAGVTVPGLVDGDPQRVAVEAYPGVMARHLLDNRSYKNDAAAKQTPALHEARVKILAATTGRAVQADYGITVDAPSSLADDPTGDSLDALLCAVQAAWAWTKRKQDYGMPANTDSLEGWIADPMAARRAQGDCHS